MAKREYYGKFQITGKKFKQRKTPRRHTFNKLFGPVEEYDGGMEITYSVDGKGGHEPITLCFGDIFQGCWVYEDHEGVERIFRVRFDYISREQMERDRMAHDALHGIDIRDHRRTKDEGID